MLYWLEKMINANSQMEIRTDVLFKIDSYIWHERDLSDVHEESDHG